MPQQLLSRKSVLGALFAISLTSNLWAHPATWCLRLGEAPESPTPRWGHAMAYDSARDVVILFGGWETGCTGGTSCFLDETWEWNGVSWTLMQPATSPDARVEHAMAYDAARGVVVLYGGRSFDTNTWTWDGTNWTLAATTGPPPREDLPMVFGTFLHSGPETALFGGIPQNGPRYSDTWVWNGSFWEERLPENDPGPLQAHNMAFDASRGAAVLFGGTADGTDYLDHTWVWDGLSWAQVSPVTKPSARVEHGMASNAHGVVLFGGWNGTQANSETWEWHSDDWSLVATTGPSPRYDAQFMVYDVLRDEVVLFGGWDGDFDGETWVYGTSCAVPAVSTWGTLITTLLFLVAGTLIHTHRTRTRPA